MPLGEGTFPSFSLPTTVLIGVVSKHPAGLGGTDGGVGHATTRLLGGFRITRQLKIVQVNF